MTITAVSNNALTQSQISQQKTETDTKHPQKSNTNPTLEKNFQDNVTLSQSGKINDSSNVIDMKEAESQLSETMKSILTHSKAALSAQTNITPQTAQELLS